MTKKILIVGPSWVGDMVMAQSLFITLKQQQPDVELHVLAPGWSLPILQRMPQVHKAVEMPLGHGELKLSTRWKLAKTLKKTGYGQAIILPGSLKSALVPYWAGIPRRTGYRGEFRFGLINDMRPLDKSILTQTVQRFVALAMKSSAIPSIPQPRLEVDHDNLKRLTEKLNLNLDQPTIAFMPGAEYGLAKQWPTEYFGSLGSQLNQAGYQAWVLGSAKDQDLGEEICTHSGPNTLSLCGKTRLTDVVDLLSACKSVVTNDSGLLHIAAAVGTHVIALYGSSTPDHTPPLTEQKDVLYLNLECSPCFQRTCPLEHYNCLRLITVEQVLDLCTTVP